MLNHASQNSSAHTAPELFGIVVLRSTPADAYGNLRPEAILAARIARAALNGVQWTKADLAALANFALSRRATTPFRLIA